MTPPRPLEPPPPMREGRIGLRLIRVSDAAALERLLRENREWLVRWEATHPSGRGIEPGSVSMRPTIRAMRKQLRTGRGVPLVMTYDDAVVGQLSISEISGGALCSAQIGYWVAQSVAGRGITPTAVALAIDYAFSHLGLHRIEICLRPENDASRRVVEKLGLRYEGRRHAYIHIDGAWRDHDCFAVTRDEADGGMLGRLAHRS
ncbi:GNAT family N-acetyltransferase [Leucobacter sp. gxy201]|uniref:GNAT family N-acetyltransferase n=1 Tax=Leucobacter sp. gxy201 TaxID=2957200 RepID=UPI003DA15DCF